MSIRVLLTVDWEGTSLKEENLERIKEFKRRWNAPLVHYLNPAYYTKPKCEPKKIDRLVDSVLAKNDELGLHLHTPKHLIDAAGITPRMSPCFSSSGDYNPGIMKGQEVMLLSYNKAEVKELIQFSLKKLNRRGYRGINSFRAGGWMADERVWESLIECGLEIESSATPAELLNGSSWEGDSLQRYIELLWGNLSLTSSPFVLETYSGNILEVPNNLGAIDYWKEDTIKKLLEKIEEDYKENKELTLVLNSHQESAKDHFYKFDQFLESLIHSFGKEEIEFCVNQDVKESREYQKVHA